jgi:hypothetical protein
MPIRVRLVVANILMSVGMVPLGFFVVWLFALMTSTPDRAFMPIGDPFSMIGPFALSFIFTAAIAGTSAAWSWDLVRAYPQSRSRLALSLRLITVALLITPFAVLFSTVLLKP